MPQPGEILSRQIQSSHGARFLTSETRRVVLSLQSWIGHGLLLFATTALLLVLFCYATSMTVKAPEWVGLNAAASTFVVALAHLFLILCKASRHRSKISFSHKLSVQVPERQDPAVAHRSPRRVPSRRRQ